MGANISSQTMTSVSTIVNTGLNKVISDITTDIVNTSTATQNVDVDLTDAVVNGTIFIEQTSEMSIRAMSKIEGDYANDMKNDIDTIKEECDRLRKLSDELLQETNAALRVC